MIAALETATEIGGVAILDCAGELRAERTLGRSDRARYAAELLPALDAALGEAGCALDDVTLVALSVGPGSFTGLRVGLATALGLCFGTARRIAPVSTLAALSLRAEAGQRIVPMLDARKGQVYTALYAPGAELVREERVAAPLDWLGELAREERGRLELLGPGARLYRNEIETLLGSRARLLAPERGWPSAAKVGWLGARIARAGGALPPETVEPRYLRASDAETAARERGRLPGHGPRRDP